MSDKTKDLTPYQVAKLYYELPYADRKFKSLLGALGLDGKSERASESKLSRLVRQWEDKGLVTHTVLSGEETYLPREPEMENALRSIYGLRGAMVINISSLPIPKSNPVTEPAPWNEYDDAIHRHLGVWGGRLLTSVLRPYDVIATGGGRGPYYAVENCNAGTDVRFHGDTISLTGQISANRWTEPARLPSKEVPFLDADFVALQLHGHLGSKGQPRLLSRPITDRRPRPTTKNCTVAIIGIGALGGGHRLKQFVHLPDVKSVVALLRTINIKSEEIEAEVNRTTPPFYHPVGDVCNWYFVVRGSAPRIDPKRLRALEASVTSLNRRFVNTTPSDLMQLATHGTVIAIAGGPHKVMSVAHVLREGKTTPWITHLVTDHCLARSLITNK